MSSREVNVINQLRLVKMDASTQQRTDINFSEDSLDSNMSVDENVFKDEDYFRFDFDMDEKEEDSQDNSFQLIVDTDDDDDTSNEAVSASTRKTDNADKTTTLKVDDNADSAFAATKGNFYNVFDGLKLSVNGNIGSGKSTFLRYLKERGLSVCEEPIESFKKMPCSPETKPLDLLYRDESTLHFLLAEMYIHFIHKLATLNYLHKKRDSKDHFVVVERMNLYDMFGYPIKRKNGMTTDLWNITKFLLFNIGDAIVPSADGIVVLDTPPDVCLERIRRRGRTEESRISLDFLQDFHNRLMDNCIADEKRGFPVLFLNNTHCGLEENYEKLIQFVRKIKATKNTC